ncbi:MAG: nucleotide excision repair endonuclease [Acidobacteria bacterium]|nr:nucleotide excision repair endonuclease [Acidobacteriota bacterium]
MRDRIFEFLKTQKKPQAADTILREALGVDSPNAATAEKVLEALVHSDPRFLNIEGFWSATETVCGSTDSELDRFGVVFLEQAVGASATGSVRGAVFVPETGFLARFGAASEQPDRVVLPRIQKALRDRPLVCWSRRELQIWKRHLTRHLESEPRGASVPLRDLAGRVLELKTRDLSIENLSARLGLPSPEADNPAAMARLLASCCQALLVRVPDEHRRDRSTLLHWIGQGHRKVDFSRFGFGSEFLRRLPESPGVYIMKNRAENIIYVGKSRNLRRRVRFYFTPASLEDPKVRRIHEQLHSLEVVPTPNEIEALLLETRLIRDFRPNINLQEEVHETPESYAREWNCVLLVPRSDARRADTYLLCGGAFVHKASVLLGAPATSGLRARIRSIYFEKRARMRKRPEPWEAELVSRWLAANRYRTNLIDVQEAGTYDNLIRLLDDYLKDPDRLANKVYRR